MQINFFTQSNSAIFDTIKTDISLFLLEQLIQKGLKLDLYEYIFSELGIFYLLPNGSFLKVVLHRSTLEEHHFKSESFPYFHILKCPAFTEEIIMYKLDNFRATYKNDNGFFISIRYKGLETRFFNDKPLEICPLCLLKYNAISQKNETKESFNLANYIKEPLFNSELEFYEALRNRSFKAEIWANITKKLKDNKNNRCIKCNKELKENLIAKYKRYQKYGIYFEQALLLCDECF